MILRYRQKPLPLQKYERLLDRLRPDFPRLPEVRFHAENRAKGYAGEKNTDYHTGFLASSNTILHDICLEIQGKSVQFDSFIINPRAIFLVESKYYSETITIDTVLKQLIRNDGKKERGSRYPITQAEMQKIKLQLWLQKYNLSHIPIFPLVSISDTTTVIKVNGDQALVADIVSHAEYIPKRILDIASTLHGENYPHRKIGERILSNCTEYDRDILGEHSIKECDLIPGVQCPDCKYLGLERRYGSWWCNRCRKKYRYAHEQALEDYLLLVKPSITSEAFMKWLKTDSRHLAKRILQKSELLYHPAKRVWRK